MKKLCLLCFLMYLPVQAIAAGNIHVGSLEIHPFISFMETYDDNIYATASDTKPDWITTITPGIKLLMPFSTHSFAAEYKAVINNYLDYTSENITDQHAGVLADFKFGSLIGLKLRDAYDKAHEARSSSASGEIEKYDRNAASAALSYVFADRFKVEVGYTLTGWDFTQDVNQYRNRKEDLIASYLYYRFLPKTSAFIEYDFKNVIFEQKVNGLDNQVNSPLLGVTWEITENTKGTVKGGYLQKSFEDPGMNGIDTWTASADLNHAFTDRSSIKVVALRDVNESNAEGARYFVTTGAFAEYTHKLVYKLSAVARVSYGEDDYSNAIAPDPDRHDKTTLGGVGLKYQMKDWLEFALNYNRLDRNSNIDIRDLTDNTISLGINFAL